MNRISYVNKHLLQPPTQFQRMDWRKLLEFIWKLTISSFTAKLYPFYWFSLSSFTFLSFFLEIDFFTFSRLFSFHYFLSRTTFHLIIRNLDWKHFPNLLNFQNFVFFPWNIPCFLLFSFNKTLNTRVKLLRFGFGLAGENNDAELWWWQPIRNENHRKKKAYQSADWHESGIFWIFLVLGSRQTMGTDFYIGYFRKI